MGDVLNFDLLKEYQPDCIIFVEISWYVLDKLEEFKQYLNSNLVGGGVESSEKSVYFVHLLMTYPEGQQCYGRDFFTNLDEIMQYWDVIDFEK